MIRPNAHEPVSIMGAGGLAVEVLSYARRAGYNVKGFIDIEEGPDVCGLPVVAEQQTEDRRMIFGIGESRIRSMIDQAHPEADWVTLIDPGAIVGYDTILGPGSVVAPGAVITASVEVGRGAVINIGATVGHGLKAGDHLTLSPNCAVSGNITMGSGVFVGAGAVILERLTISSGAIIGAGAVVTRNIDEPGVYVGVPAKRVGDA